MTYVLVMLQKGSNESDRPSHDQAHVEFIDSLIRDNLVLLGGSLDSVAGIRAAYLLKCSDIQEAHRLVMGDPYVRHGVFTPQLVEWRLVAINPGAIDQSLVITPQKIR